VGAELGDRFARLGPHRHVVDAAALAAMLVPAEYLAHLFGNASLSTRDLLGIGFHIVACVGVGIGWALFVKHVL